MIDKFESKRLGFIEDQEKLEKLYQMGVIDNKGDPIPFHLPNEDDMK